VQSPVLSYVPTGQSEMHFDSRATSPPLQPRQVIVLLHKVQELSRVAHAREDIIP